MSAEDTGNAAPVDNGPVIITVMGQEAPEPVVEAKAEVEEVEVKEVEPKAAGSEESNAERRDDKGRNKPGVQERIDELTRARREAEREAEYWKVRAQGTAEPAKAAEAPKVPVKGDFESEEAYLEALTDHKVDQKLAQRDQQKQEVEQQVSKAGSWQSKLEAARTEIPDFDKVMEAATAPVAAHVAELIMESDMGAKVMHHFATNPEELAKLNEASPAKAAMMIGRLEAKFDAPSPTSSSSKPAAAENVSKAPPPAAQNVGSGRATETALGDLSMDDYIARRKAQGAGWAR